MNFIDIYKYLDYRDFLRDYHTIRKARETKFSHRFFAMQAGYSSSGLYTHIIQGQLNLTPHYIPGFIKAMKMDEKEAEYFKLLIDYTHAQDDHYRVELYDQMLVLTPLKLRRTRMKMREFYSKWYIPSILLLLRMEDFEDSLKELSLSLFPKVTLPQCKSAIKLLADLKLIHKVDGFWKPTIQSTVGGKEVGVEVIRQHQRDMMTIACDALDQFDPSHRHITTKAISLSEKTFQKIQDEIKKFQLNVNKLVDYDEAPDRVFHLNLQLFPTSILRPKHEK